MKHSLHMPMTLETTVAVDEQGMIVIKQETEDDCDYHCCSLSIDQARRLSRFLAALSNELEGEA
ncbi:MAG: hypothetical protein LBR05_00925 [Azoarcus sp.]|jgi:hypothetical protein|nr:hypothetical protein [Azoarcus sp.]